MTTATRTFCAQRSYATLGSGSFPISLQLINAVVESEVFIVYTNTGAGNTFALKNITLIKRDEDTAIVTFDPLTDVHAVPASILPRDQLTNSAMQALILTEDLKDVPRFCVANNASGNYENPLTLDAEDRARLMQYKGGLISLTELVLALYEHGITISDIHQNTRNREDKVALMSSYPTHVIELNKDNGVIDNNNHPRLARLSVLL